MGQILWNRLDLGSLVFITVKRALVQKVELRFAVVGTWNTAIGFGVFVFILSKFSPPLTGTGAIVLSYIVSLCNSYAMQRKFVWNSTSSRVYEFQKFSVVSTLQFTSNIFLFHLLVDEAGHPPIMTQAVITVFLVIASFFGMKWWAFDSPNSSKDPSKINPRINDRKSGS